MNITVSPEFMERREANQSIEFIVRKSGLTERAVEVIAFTRNSSLTGIDIITLRACARGKAIGCVRLSSVCHLSAQKLPDPKIQAS